jgi:hypothetical protein
MSDAEELAGRRRSAKATLYGYASVRSFNSAGRQMLKSINPERSASA